MRPVVHGGMAAGAGMLMATCAPSVVPAPLLARKRGRVLLEGAGLAAAASPTASISGPASSAAVAGAIDNASTTSPGPFSALAWPSLYSMQVGTSA